MWGGRYPVRILVLTWKPLCPICFIILSSQAASTRLLSSDMLSLHNNNYRVSCLIILSSQAASNRLLSSDMLSLPNNRVSSTIKSLIKKQT